MAQAGTAPPSDDDARHTILSSVEGTARHPFTHNPLARLMRLKSADKFRAYNSAMDLANAFIEPPKRPATLDEAEQIIAALWRLLQDCREQLALNSSNSSLPPSQDRLSGKAKDRFSRQPSGKRRGAQEGHVAHTRDLVPEAEVDRIERHFPEAQLHLWRRDCHRSTSRVSTSGLRSAGDHLPGHRTSALWGHLPLFSQRFVTAQLPQETPSGQMGPGLIAWIALMSGHFRLSTRNIQSLLEMQWGLHFSTGAISEAQELVAEWLGSLVEHIAETVRQAPVAHANETTHFRGPSRHWLWVLCTPQLAFFMVHASRGMKAARQLLEDFSGILVTDHHGAYRLHPLAQRQLCSAHVIRNLERIAGRKEGARRTRPLAGQIRPHHHSTQDTDGERAGIDPSTIDDACSPPATTFAWHSNKASRRNLGQRTGNACKKLLADEPMLWTFLKYPRSGPDQQPGGASSPTLCHLAQNQLLK